MDAKQLQAYRTSLYSDLYAGIVPDRFPVHDALSWQFLMQYAGEDPVTAQFDVSAEKITGILQKGSELLRGDTFLGAGGQNPAVLMFQQCAQSVMSTTGMIQHPEREYMRADEYGQFIENPLDFMLETAAPRFNPSYAKGEVFRSFYYALSLIASYDSGAQYAQANRQFIDSHGFYTAPPGSGSHQYIPFDFIADHARGFSQIPIDIRRQPQKVIQACEAFVPYCLWAGQNAVQSPLGSNMIPTHMGPYLKNSDFEKFYWPTLSQIVHMTAQRGQSMMLFLENDWTRFIDYLEELPMGTRLYMEYGDAEKFKDRLGRKMVLSGFYPLTMLRNCTKQQCIDKAKELIDILAPGGNFYFNFDKMALSLSDITAENYTAVLEYALNSGKYDNAGSTVSSMKKEDTIKKYTAPEFKSKYVVSFEDFIKEYPPAAERAEPLMKKEYQKYTDMLRLGLIHMI